MVARSSFEKQIVLRGAWTLSLGLGILDPTLGTWNPTDGTQDQRPGAERRDLESRTQGWASEARGMESRDSGPGSSGPKHRGITKNAKSAKLDFLHHTDVECGKL